MNSEMQDPVRLTQMVKSAGCAAKIFPNLLADALSGINWLSNENVLRGFEGKDDAGVYKINEDLALIQTTDFFTPVVDDPYTYGAIAAANALSDVYAMGGTPVCAMNIVAFPQSEDMSILKEILRGGADKTREADTVIIGGHSVDIPNIVYGLAVTGFIHPEKVKTNSNARPGDKLILTKALGTGIMNNAVKFSNIGKSELDGLLSNMLRLNRNAGECMSNSEVSACTDITGFGLAGHSMQLAKESKVNLKFHASRLPLLEGVMEAIDQGMLTRGDKSNREYTQSSVVAMGDIDKKLEHILYDPQTSGGLLISVNPDRADALLRDLRNGGDVNSVIVGEVLSRDDQDYGKVFIEYD